MRRLFFPALVLFFLLATVVAVAQQPQAIMPKLITNATWVYVTSYDGAEPNPRISPEDLQAISTVQDALKSWGKYKLVYRPEAAEIIILVHTSRPWSATRGHWDDEMAIYDARNWRTATWLWREMAIDGLQGPNPPLVESFRHQVEQAEFPERPGYALNW